MRMPVRTVQGATFAAVLGAVFFFRRTSAEVLLGTT
jgi:hypothetical protein